MKTTRNYSILAVLIIGMIISGCSKDDADDPINYGTNSASKSLTLNEKEGLLSIAEFQKLHRDIYTVFVEKSSNPVFLQLLKKDRNFVDLISIRIDKYGLDNPLRDNPPGEYFFSRVQQVYNSFEASEYTTDLQMLQYALSMEDNMLEEVSIQKQQLTGNADIDKLYGEMCCCCETQLSVIMDELKVENNQSRPMVEIDEF